jgi:ABC-type dipeptide/oligopeptide/nickel transport system ATPase component
MADALKGNTSSLLEVEQLSVSYRGRQLTPAVVNAHLSLLPKEIIGVVGQSGSGKSTLGMAIAGLLDPSQCVVSGVMKLGDTRIDLSDSTSPVWRTMRGSQIGYVFQDAQAALNPLLTIQQLLVQPQRHRGIDTTTALRRVRELLEAVEIPDIDRRLRQYPHELSGGMKQRVVIAAALLGNPRIIIADEPTTALDVTLQAQIIRLLKRLKDELELSIIFISHDIDLVADIANQILVMKEGVIIDTGPSETVVQYPSHPYTQELVSSIPRLARIGYFNRVEHWVNHA